jgi:hypothetical protein
MFSNFTRIRHTLTLQHKIHHVSNIFVHATGIYRPECESHVLLKEHTLHVVGVSHSPSDAPPIPRSARRTMTSSDDAKGTFLPFCEFESEKDM